MKGVDWSLHRLSLNRWCEKHSAKDPYYSRLSRNVADKRIPIGDRLFQSLQGNWGIEPNNGRSNRGTIRWLFFWSLELWTNNHGEQRNTVCRNVIRNVLQGKRNIGPNKTGRSCAKTNHCCSCLRLILLHWAETGSRIWGCIWPCITQHRTPRQESIRAVFESKYSGQDSINKRHSNNTTGYKISGERQKRKGN